MRTKFRSRTERLRLFVVALWLSGIGAWAGLPAYFFADFEATSGWQAGALPPERSGLRLTQGTAAVRANEEKESAQILELGPSSPFPAIFVPTTVVAKAPVVYCELLAQPAAVDPDQDAEFLDFGGAIVGFFRQGPRAEVRVLFARSAEESVWISSGHSFALDEGGALEPAAEWRRGAGRAARVAGGGGGTAALALRAGGTIGARR